MRCCDMRMKENKIMKMISRRDFMKASAVVGAAGVLTACGGSPAPLLLPPPLLLLQLLLQLLLRLQPAAQTSVSASISLLITL